MKSETEKWRDRYLLLQQGMETIRRELGCKPDESTIDAIRRLRRRSPTEEVKTAQ